ncbi:MAG: hypothetical protein IPL79_08465 [Myxococcales bacterium]|nr:hypothetical protein [Myxococcales bacterium]
MTIKTLGLACFVVAISAAYAAAGGHAKPQPTAKAGASTYKSHVKTVDRKGAVTEVKTKGMLGADGKPAREVETRTDAGGTSKTFRFGAAAGGFRVEATTHTNAAGEASRVTKTRVGKRGAIYRVTSAGAGGKTTVHYVAAPLKFPSTIVADLVSEIKSGQFANFEFVDRAGKLQRVVLMGGLAADVLASRLKAVGFGMQ